ncbi:hypothetical protein NBRC116602_27190 [Hyphomicrobiales bacterium 4NK60-0047b]
MWATKGTLKSNSRERKQITIHPKKECRHFATGHDAKGVRRKRRLSEAQALKYGC